jgi:endoglucanase
VRRTLRLRVWGTLATAVAVVGGIGAISNSPPVSAAPETNRGGPTFQMRRAVNVSPGFIWVRYSDQGKSGRPVLDPPYSRFQSWTNEELPQDYPNIKALGFDTVRFGIEPTPFLDFTGTRLEQLEGEVTDKVDQMLNAGLNVIIDLHPFNPKLLGFNDAGDLNNPQYQAYVRMVQRFAVIAERYDPVRVALELQNEPHDFSCEAGKGWNRYQPDLARAARAVAPRTTFILTGGCWGGRAGLQTVDPSAINDPNTYYSAHFYDNVLFTHQGFRGMGGWIQHVSDFRYPSKPSDFDVIWPKVEARIKADPGEYARAHQAEWLTQARNEIRYFTVDRQLNRNKLSEYLQQIAQWADSNGISRDRVFLGEFGVIRPTRSDAAGTTYPDANDRITWYRDVRQLSEEKGFAWSVFNYAGRYGILDNMNMYPETPRVIFPEMVDALGLNGNATPATTVAPTTVAPTTTAAPTTTSAPTTVPPTTTGAPTTTSAPNPDPTLTARVVVIRSACDKDKALDIRGQSKAPGAVVQLYWPNGLANQRFALQPRGGDRFQVVNQHSGLALGAPANVEGQLVIQQSIIDPGSNNWDVINVGNDLYEFRRPNTNLALDIQWGSTAVTTPLHLWSANGTCAQRFRLQTVA